MNDKQRLDSYVLAAMTGMVGNVSLLSTATTGKCEIEVNKEKEVLLSQQRLKEVLFYDKDTGVFTWSINKNSRARAGQIAGCLKGKGYIEIGIDGCVYLAHRLAWLYVYGEFPHNEREFYIDHINGKRADNRITNLRCSSHADNMRNQQMQSNNTSGATGVRRTGMWNGNRTKKNWYWVAFWYNVKAKNGMKSFNIETYGEEQARKMAIEYRAEQLRLLEVEHGIYYLARHGT